MNDENLKPFKKGSLSSEEAVRNGSKGGIKSGESRRRKKQLKETLIDILEAKYPDKKTGKKHTGVEIIAMRLFESAIDNKSRNYNKSLSQLLSITGLDLSDEERKRIENGLKLQTQEIELNEKKIEKMDEDWI